MTVTLVVEYPDEADRDTLEPDVWDWDTLCGDPARVIHSRPSRQDERELAFDSGEPAPSQPPPDSLDATVTIYPHGIQMQQRYEAWRADGKSDAEAHEASQPFEVAWPDGIRLPVPGDSLSVAWATGLVKYVSFVLDDEGDAVEWDIRIKLDL